jgi:hypothetical protein
MLFDDVVIGFPLTNTFQKTDGAEEYFRRKEDTKLDSFCLTK